MLIHCLIAALLMGTCAEETPHRLLHITVYVDTLAPGPGTGTPSDPFPTISAALAYVIPHDYIVVRPGVYNEVVDLPFFIFLRSEQGAANTTIDASGLAGTHAVTLGPLAEIEGFTIRKTDGGGLLMTSSPGTPEFGRKVRGNRVVDCSGGGITLSGPCHPFLSENVVAGCVPHGIRLDGGASPWIGGCTLSQNATGITQVGIPDGTGIIVNNIIYGNTTEFQGVAAVEIHNSCVGDGSFAGINGNFHSDPVFVAGAAKDFRLQGTSPCIEAGDGNHGYISGFFDAEGYGHPRLFDADHDGTAAADLGAHEWGELQAVTLATPAGQTLWITLTTGPGTNWLLAMGTHNTNPLSLPGTVGFLYLDPSSAVVLLAGSMGASGALALPIPLTNPALLGLEVTLQAVAADSSGSAPQVRLTSTETVRT